MFLPGDGHGSEEFSVAIEESGRRLACFFCKAHDGRAERRSTPGHDKRVQGWPEEWCVAFLGLSAKK